MVLDARRSTALPASLAPQQSAYPSSHCRLSLPPQPLWPCFSVLLVQRTREAGSNLSSPARREQTKGSPGMDDTTTALPDLWNTHASITRDASNAKSTQTRVLERVWRGARGVECGDPTLLAHPAALASLSCSRPCLPHAASPFLPHILPDGSLPFFFAFSASAGLRGKHTAPHGTARSVLRVAALGRQSSRRADLIADRCFCTSSKQPGIAPLLASTSMAEHP